MKNVKEFRLNLCILILSMTLLLLIPLNAVKGSIVTESHCHTCFQYNLSSLSQKNYVIPTVKVREIIFPEQQLEEGKIINLTIIIENKEDVSLFDFKLIIVLTEITDTREEKPVSKTINKSLDMIPAISNVTDHISFTSEFGEYILTACLAYGDIVVPNSSFSAQVHILSPPIGDIPTLLLALGGTLAFILLAVPIPGIIDKIRFFSRKNPLKERGRKIKDFLNWTKIVI
ncbi:MAG: hypothetical protein ACFFDI_31445 [Promethearchaeota archaeon]